MFKIITPDGKEFLTEKPNFVRVHTNNCFILCTREKAEGIAYHGTPYLFKDGTMFHEVDAGDVYAGMEEVNNITFVALAETKVLDDDTAARHATVFPVWAVGVAYKAGQMRTDPLNGKLYRVNEGQAHTSVEGWNPSLTPAMWTLVDVTHAGTMEDPIPYDSGMELEAGLYYIQNDVVYRCFRSTGTPVHHELSALVGLYVEAAE